jgi:hypothetical protein
MKTQKKSVALVILIALVTFVPFGMRADNLTPGQKQGCAEAPDTKKCCHVACICKNQLYKGIGHDQQVTACEADCSTAA